MPTSLSERTTEIVRPIRKSVVLLVVRVFFVLLIADSVYAALLLLSALEYIPVELVATYATLLWVIYTRKFILFTYVLITMIIDWLGTMLSLTPCAMKISFTNMYT